MPADAAAPSRDPHFRLRGPVVPQLAEVFAEDWHFATDEVLRGAPWFVPCTAAGEVLARCIDDGPDESTEPLRWSMVAGLNQAQRSVKIMTPYFVPDSALITALDVTAMRGVEVDILLPSVSDLPHVHWAAWGQLWQVLERGCRIWSRVRSGQMPRWVHAPQHRRLGSRVIAVVSQRTHVRWQASHFSWSG